MLVLKKINLLVGKYTHLVAFMFSVLPNLVEFESGLKSDDFCLYDLNDCLLILSCQSGYRVLFSCVSSLWYPSVAHVVLLTTSSYCSLLERARG